MRTISVLWQAELAKAQPEVYPAFVASIKNAAGTTEVHTFVTIGGDFRTNTGTMRMSARLISVGNYKLGFDPISPSIMLSDSEVVLADPDGLVYQMFGAAKNRNAECYVAWVSPNVPEELVRYSGLMKSWAPNSGTLTIQLGPDDRKFDTAIPVSPILRSDWPGLTGATASNYGSYPAIVLGSHSSDALSGTGMVPCLPVAWTSGSVGWYTPSAHACKAVADVFVNGTLKTLTTHYTVAISTVGGKTWQVIKFTAGNIPLVGDVVTADVDGAELYGTGGGTLVTNPVMQLRKFLVDYVFSTHLTGGYASANVAAMIDEDKVQACADIADGLKLEGAVHIGGSNETIEAREFVERWLESWPMFRLWRDAEDRVALSYIDLGHPGYRDETGYPVVRRAHELKDPVIRDNISRSAGTVSVEHLYGAADGEYFGRVTVDNPDSIETATETFSLAWSAARAQ